MTLFLSLLPLYLVGNLHCAGMCGPLVLMLGKHRYRWFYFLGRTASFALAAGFAGGIGAVLDLVLRRYHIPAAASFLFGSILFLTGLYSIFGWHYPGYGNLAKLLGKTSQRLSLLLLKDDPGATFLFGFCTVLLPCGQTLLVFTACALAGDFTIGLANGAAFALLTSPSLAAAMHASRYLHGMRIHYNTLMGVFGILAGGLALARGFAEVGFIPHLVLNERYHIVLF